MKEVGTESFSHNQFPGKINLSTNQQEYFMISYDELKPEMESIQQQMVEVKKNKSTNSLQEVKHLCEELGFTARMLKSTLFEGRKKL